MKAKFFAELEAKVSEWMEWACQEDDWPPVYIGKRTEEYMARAAAAVLDACAESQEHERVESEK